MAGRPKIASLQRFAVVCGPGYPVNQQRALPQAAQRPVWKRTTGCFETANSTHLLLNWAASLSAARSCLSSARTCAAIASTLDMSLCVCAAVTACRGGTEGWLQLVLAQDADA